MDNAVNKSTIHVSQPSTVEQPAKRIAWSIDGESFSHDELGEALDACDGDGTLAAGRVIEFGEVYPFDPAQWVDSDDVLEMLADRGADNGGEWAEDYPDVSNAAKDELDAFLAKWLREHCTPRFYGIKNTQKYIVSQEDIDDWKAPMPSLKIERGA